MKLTSKEIDRLQIFTAGEMARRRKQKGIRLNYPESVALITDEVLEAVRSGVSYEDVVNFAGGILSCEDVMEGVKELIEVIQVEAIFPDGTRLLTIRNPIR